jgi:signal transduction histidine kinase
LLPGCAEELGLGLYLEMHGRAPASQLELVEQARQAEVGELAAPLAHEFSNFLNTLLLHIAILETETPAHLRTELAEIQEHSAAVTALLKQFQQYRRRQEPAFAPVDLNHVVRSTIAALCRREGEQLWIEAPAVSEVVDSAPQPGPLVPVELALGAALPPVPAGISELRRLLTFLLRNAAGATASENGRVLVSTELANGKVRLRVEDTGPEVPAELLSQLFEPGCKCREGVSSLELAACRTLAQRLKGAVQATRSSEGGVAVSVDFG